MLQSEFTPKLLVKY